MSKFLKDLNKHFKKIYLLIPFLLCNKDNIIIVTVILLLFYIHNISKKYINKDKNIKSFNINDILNEINILEKKINNSVNNNNNDNNNDNNDNNNDNNDNNNNSNQKINTDLNSSSNPIKENIIMNIEKVEPQKTKSIRDNMEYTPYGNDKCNIKKNYTEKPDNYDFSINVNSTICSTPIFNLRTYKDINFYFNFIIHNYDTTKIHNLILCKDIHKWMNNSTLSDQDISNELVPIYFLSKINDKVNVYEYLKVFIHETEDGKIAFVQKGNDYLIIEKYINELIDKEIIYDLLDGKMYNSYNLYSNDGINYFLNKFLSLVLISENSIGEQVKLDIENYHENKSSYEYFFNTVNADSSIFNTTI